MSQRYYLAEPLNPGLVLIDGPEAHHLSTVCRLRVGDALVLFNGDGTEYPGRVVQVNRKSVEVELAAGERPDRELPFRLEVAAPLPKGDRTQFLVEKLTELGVTVFTPLACERSVIHPREGKREKLERYVIEASKQCGRNTLMEVAELTDWASWCLPRDVGEARLLAHPGGTAEMRKLAAPTRIAVGPEGGFTDAEAELALTHGWQHVGLGPRILRIETAAVALVALATGG
jgi:16S rRNA (uracil1498-N3)-methyltransferase